MRTRMIAEAAHIWKSCLASCSEMMPFVTTENIVSKTNYPRLKYIATPSWKTILGGLCCTPTAWLVLADDHHHLGFTPG